ncbi:hypothetical protein J7I97_03145 [Streptomyces sp. ISL-87]|nr:hypothetical protein [Streptomyces sp. ISL-21]MBT2607322.1 hypothetical protein [Streptomyces sp. ISL-87]
MACASKYGVGVMGRVRRTALAGAVALGLAVGLPGAVHAAGPSSEPVPQYRPADGAQNVAGKPTSADAPLLSPGKVYEDVISPEDRFYQLNLDDKSSVYVSAVVRPPAGAKVGYSDDVEVTIMTTGGKACPGNPGRASFGSEAGTISAVGVRRLEEDADCTAGGTYFVKVTRTAAKDSDQRSWPVELLVKREPVLGGGNAPTTAPSVWPSASPTLPGTAPVGRAGGTGFNDARAVGTGVWRDDLRPGQTRFYRVPLDWGQQLGLSAELANASMTKDYGFAAAGLKVSLYTPYRGLADSKDTTYDGKQAAVALPKTAPVAYVNRFADDAEMRAMRVAGWYYIAVTMGANVGEFIEDAQPVPLTLRMEVIGSPAKAPAYKESLSAAGFGVGDDDRAAAKDGLTAPEAADAAGTRSVMRVVAGAGFGTGTLLLLGLGGWIVLARRPRH